VTGKIDGTSVVINKKKIKEDRPLLLLTHPASQGCSGGDGGKMQGKEIARV